MALPKGLTETESPYYSGFFLNTSTSIKWGKVSAANIYIVKKKPVPCQSKVLGIKAYAVIEKV